MLVHIKTIVSKAQKGGYAVGAFNTSNLEVTLGIIRGAVAKKSPVIIQVSESTIKYAGLKMITNMVQTLANNEAKDVPIALHLDHGKSFRSVSECVRAGFSSVHIDASDLPFEENVSLTKQAVDYAHRYGVWAQAELGSMIGKEGMTTLEIPKDPDSFMTDPSKVKEFIKRTNVDTLAISVGTMHGYFKGKEKIDFPRLEKINREIPKMPLVLHGASGLINNDVSGSIKLGVRIINIDTDLRIAFTETLRQTLKQTPKGFYDPRKILSPSIEAIATRVEEQIEVFGSYKK
jgi:fructose-bisphosphate aldolase, class II